MFSGWRVAVVAGTAALLCVFVGPAPVWANGDPPATEDDFAYPNADQIFKEHGVRLLLGNGLLVFANCDNGSKLVEVRALGNKLHCFKVVGVPGWVTMELKDALYVRTRDFGVAAKIVADGKTAEFVLGKNDLKTVGEADGNGAPPAALMELKVSSF